MDAIHTSPRWMSRKEANPGPLLLLHPEGAVGSARSGMILADVTRLSEGTGFRPAHDLAAGVRATLLAEGVLP